MRSLATTHFTRRAFLARATSGIAAASGVARVGLAAQMPQHIVVDSAALAGMRDVASAFMSKYDVPGMAVAIAKAGEVVFNEGFGLADKATNERVTPAHLFRIASVSKPITSATIFTL